MTVEIWDSSAIVMINIEGDDSNSPRIMGCKRTLIGEYGLI